MDFDFKAGRVYPKKVCSVDCPACVEAARDKEWAVWLLERSTADGITIDGVPYPLTLIDKDDFEALKKLAGKE
jgi:hypothetical protein